MLALRFRETWRFAPLLLPMIVMIHFAAPGTLGALKYSFMPPGGLVAEQSNDEYVEGAGRIADIGPSIELFKKKPVLGYGYGTLQTSGPDANSRILDNQWLSSLLNLGLVGVFSLIWLFTRFLRGMTRSARRLRTPDGWLLVALCASVAAFGICMFTFDAFAFTQVLSSSSCSSGSARRSFSRRTRSWHLSPSPRASRAHAEELFGSLDPHCRRSELTPRRSSRALQADAS